MSFSGSSYVSIHKPRVIKYVENDNARHLLSRFLTISVLSLFKTCILNLIIYVYLYTRQVINSLNFICIHFFQLTSQSKLTVNLWKFRFSQNALVLMAVLCSLLVMCFNVCHFRVTLLSSRCSTASC
jgi:hypothetical protein